MYHYQFCLGDSLDKIFPLVMPKERENPLGAGCFAGERASFQIGYTVECSDTHMLEEGLHFEVKARPAVHIQLYKVGLVPSAFPCSGLRDEDYLTTEPGLFPDVLEALPSGDVMAVAGQWRALWVRVCPEEDCEPGDYEIEVTAGIKGGDILWRRICPCRVYGEKLPVQSLIHTEQFHADCLADYYGVEVFSKRHWEIMERFIALAAESGINMIFTPLFTPPMDTAVGGERTTVQLVGVEQKKDGWKFDFSFLSRWVAMCRAVGIRYFEMAPLFTQWGAKAAPKIMALAEGEQRQVFGWDTPAAGEAYHDFLTAFLPELKGFLSEEGVLEDTWFHVSDEPSEKDLDSYRYAAGCLREGLGNCHFLDALSDFEFYRLGLVRCPAVSTDHMEPFLKAEISGLWAYYCCVQGVDVSNRFFAMPSGRNRILGVQLYLYRIQGFLHWGYNFYNTRFSLKHIDPYAVTDSGESFPSGDPFLVYPGEDGFPVSSIRLEVLREGLEDLRALQKLESMTSRVYVEQLIEETAGMKITFREYPRNHGFLQGLRSRVNREIGSGSTGV